MCLPLFIFRVAWIVCHVTGPIRLLCPRDIGGVMAQSSSPISSFRSTTNFFITIHPILSHSILIHPCICIPKLLPRRLILLELARLLF